MTEPGSFDVAIVGAGPNGLTAAAYLARAGARVVLLEKRFERGGTFATDDYSTPFQYNLAQFELPLGEDLPPVSDLGLRAQAVRFVEPSLPFAARAETRGPELVIGRGGRGLGGGIEEMFAAVSEAVAPLLYGAPREEPQILAELESGGGLAAVALSEATPRSLAAGVEDSRAAVILRYACGLAGWLDADEPLGLVGAFCLARLFSPSIVAGGTKSLANAITRVAFSAGARGLLSSRVTRVEPAGEGFELLTADGRMTRATAVVSTLDPRSTFSGLLADDLVPDDLRAAVEAWRVEPTAAFTAHYGIKGAPPVPAGDGADALCRIFGFAGPEEVERHHAAALGGRLANRVAGHLTAVTAHDPLQASPGPYGPLHTLRLQTTVPFRHPAGPWDRERVRYRRDCWDAAVASFEGLEQATLLFAFCDSPHDLERRFATTRGGSLRQGSLVRGQTLSGRPHPSCASGRTPIPGFYLGGGAVHPGVPGCLGGGYNAAGCVADDLGLERWWARPPAPELTARAAR